MYRVVQNLTVKVHGLVKTFHIGSIVNLPEKSAQMFIQQGKIESVITESEQQTSVQESKKKSPDFAPTLERSEASGRDAKTRRPSGSVEPEGR